MAPFEMTPWYNQAPAPWDYSMLRVVMSNRENFTIDYRDTIGDQLSIDLSKLSNTMNQFEFIMYFKIF